MEGDDLDRQSFWTVTRPNGDRCRLPSHGRPQELEGVTICVAFDPDTKQVGYAVCGCTCRVMSVWWLLLCANLCVVTLSVC